MKDRIAKYPGRVKLTPVPGEDGVYDMSRADQPTEVGTPLNKGSLLSDETAAALGLSEENPTVNDAFMGVKGKIDHVFKVGDTLTTARRDLGPKWLLCNGSTFGENLPLATLFPPATFETPGAWTNESIQPNNEQNMFAYKGDLFWICRSNDNANFVLKILRGKTFVEEKILVPTQLQNGSSNFSNFCNMRFDPVLEKILVTSANAERDILAIYVDPKTLSTETIKTSQKADLWVGSLGNVIIHHTLDGFLISWYRTRYEPTGYSFENQYVLFFCSDLTAGWAFRPFATYMMPYSFVLPDKKTVYYTWVAYAQNSANVYFLRFGDNSFNAAVPFGPSNTQQCFAYDPELNQFFGYTRAHYSSAEPWAWKIDVSTRSVLFKDHYQGSGSPAMIRKGGKTYMIKGGNLIRLDSENGLNSNSNTVTLASGFPGLSEYTSGKTILDLYDFSFFCTAVPVYEGPLKISFPAYHLPTVANNGNLYTYIRAED